MVECPGHPEDPYASFGWKTSYEHWNDDAVWGYGSEPFGGPWGELVYPPQHEFAGQSIDLAFRLGGTPVEFDYDFGDAPDPTYPTLRMSDGARHRVPANPALYFGSSIDIEADGQPSPGATRDDTSGIDDEDGIDFADWISPGGTGQVEVTLSMTGIVDAWIDFAGDGSWAQPEDHIFAGMPVPAGAHVFSFAVPETGIEGHDSFARFRVRSSAAPLGYFGEAVDGEVEDYMVYIQDDASGTEDQVPERFGLEQNLPNPFNPWTEIAFSVPAGGGEVRLEIFDPSGRRVAVLLDEHRDAGRHSVIWKGRDEAGRQLSSGIYHCLFSAGDFRETRKMVMLR